MRGGARLAPAAQLLRQARRLPLSVRARGWEIEGYRLPDHPLQQELLALVAETVGRPADDIATAVDGCGVPTFALSLVEMARLFAGLARGRPDGPRR